MASNKSIEYHQQWIGYLNPTGLVFSPHALDDAQAVINESVISEQKEFLNLVTKTLNDSTEFIGFENVRDLFFKVLNWRESDLNPDPTIIAQYSFSHPQFGEVISPTYVTKVNDEKIILIQQLAQDDFDKTANTEDAWNSSPHFKFERLLREKQISTGFIVSKEKLRLIFAQRGESSGYIDFPFKIMYQPSGRLVFAAFRELLSATKVFNSPKGQSLIEILELSRKYQAQVSIELSGQVLAALYELLRGFQTANDDGSGKLLEKTLKENPQLIYEGLLTTLLRMVFIMYAEDRNLLAIDEVYQSSYSLAGLYERLRQDEAQNPDTMDSRYGAWAYLISLFRLIYDGAEYDSEKGKVVLPARHGHLFDPNMYLFLEGRNFRDQLYSKAPKISDGVVFRVLKNLIVLNGERISYRTLDVEQIGSVYETMMGFELGRAAGETIALKPAKSHGAPLPINLDEILAAKDKSKKLGEVSELKLSDKVKKEVNECKTIEELESVLDKRIDRRATPFRLSKDAMVLVPSEARRKSGSHYTPRELTEPIVRVALEPILKNLGDKPTPEQIIDLKICDPAMGSGAFLVEVCRQISEKLVESWAAHKVKVIISADEDELLHARRLIAQKCLYGVDKNHMAVNLAKLSIWLVTLAKDHAFTFLDHNIKHGDSLVGLKNKQIEAFDYAERGDLPLFQYVKDQLKEAIEAREEIIHATHEQNYEALKEIEEEYLDRLAPLRLVGNLALRCFFDGHNEKERAKKLEEHRLVISNFLSANNYEKLEKYCREKLSEINSQFVPFHWELEFPEVFIRTNKGFDCFIGNPPFAGKNSIISGNAEEYYNYLLTQFNESSGNADLVSYFLKRTFSFINSDGVCVLITTNSVAQGETRESGLSYIVKTGGHIFYAIRRKRWPGDAAVVVSIVGITKKSGVPTVLDGVPVTKISSHLLKNIDEVIVQQLIANRNKAFKGGVIMGDGFIFDDNDENCAGSTTLAKSFLAKNENNSQVLMPFIGGKEISSSPIIQFSKYIINFGEMSLEEASKYSDLIEIVRLKVKPIRDKISGNNNDAKKRRENWWLWGRNTPGIHKYCKTFSNIIVCAHTGTHKSFTFFDAKSAFDQSLIVFASDNFSFFSVLQSTVHFIWILLNSSSMKDDLRYTPSDSFETFPFPNKYEENSTLLSLGQEYFTFRSHLMTSLSEGLTKLYNRFHDPNETCKDILKLRELHCKIDREIIASYGWNDIDLKYEFILDFEEEDDESLSNRKKPYRYRFNEEVHFEILSRLIKLNNERYTSEVRLGLHKR
ncbi:MAG: hypothetical protein RJB66_1362 [Pseudomonadota bacterium]|jgi:hypothetical protein